ncbi:PREDICTED: cell growth regulator with RING finger domain protein 1 [Nanorana parkeri]|uniref:cell growth regulator with RING finger domain protein 1 n=1 Tax=Nanorana parkeri TaxID=125878 RepID=UPI00085423F4|nr:PREDICTED: cell growth regulator with RING finger domain protein 1 [Nanorana parkeri]
MPAIFLTTLYEYSPPFYIAVVFVCFVVTCGLVLGWFGVDVPVILRNSDDSASNTFLSRRQMVQVKNPFGLEIANPDGATIATGVTLRPHCLEESTLTCYWGCNVQKVQEALQKHVYCFRITTPGALEEALYSEYLYREQHVVRKESKEDILLRLPEDNEMEDFGPVPRTRYPLIALLTLSHADDRELYPIVSMLSVIHIPDRSYRLPCRIIYQYLLTAQGQFHDLKQLYMSTSEHRSESTEAEDNQDCSRDKELLQKFGLSEEEEEEEEEETQEGRGKDCVVCQNDTVNWVLLPCRHVCLCDGCLTRFQHCPICRHFVQESFPLRSGTPPTG